jgi:hypothetical protein
MTVALAELRRCSGRQSHPGAVTAFCTIAAEVLAVVSSHAA